MTHVPTPTVTVRVVGYCASCRNLNRHDEELPMFGLGRFGVCHLGVQPVTGGNGMCDRYQPLRPARTARR